MSQTADDENMSELADVFRRHSADLYRRARFLTQGDSHAARDLVQEVFQAAAMQWGQFRSYDEEHRVHWLFRVLRNKYVDLIRAHKREPDAAPPDHDWAAPDETARQALCAVTLHKCWAVIEQMPPEQHRVAVLRWAASWTSAEIAEALGIKPSTVRVHLMNARKGLLNVVGPDLPFGEGTEEGTA
jgi:RNA polymerase sigma-70 factor (ECF subfamily)